MEKTTIEIPRGTRFLSELQDFQFPDGILNKDITGCGATTLALTDSHPTIIASPRVALVKNKAKDIERYGFSCREYYSTVEGKRVHGYELRIQSDGQAG